MEKQRESVSSIEELNSSHSDREASEVESDVEVATSKRQRKVPAKLKDREASMDMAEGEVESDVEVNVASTSKRQRKVPAKLRDSSFIAKQASGDLDLEAEMRDSKSCMDNHVRCEIVNLSEVIQCCQSNLRL